MMTSASSGCHPERSEGPLRPQERSLAALGMTALLWSSNHLLVMQPGDFMVRQLQNTRKDLVRMLAERRRRLGRRALEGGELKGRGGDGITADAGLVEHAEHGIVEHVLAARRELAKGLIGRPQRARRLQGSGDFGRRL